LLAGCGASKPPAASPPSVLVGLQAPVRGSLPDMVVAYGSAAPSLNASETLSVAQPGQVTRLATTAGSAVRAGQALVVFTTAPSAVSSFEQAMTSLTAAQKQRATTAELLRQQLATRDQLVQADKAVSDAVTALDALRRDGAGHAARTLTAPYDGIVTNVAVAQGDRTQPGAALITVAKASGVVITVGVDPADRARVRPGQSARLERLAGGQPLAGRVVRIDSMLNPKTRQIDVDLAFPAGAIMPGEALQANIRVGDIAGWLVPHRAVVTSSGDARIYQLAYGKALGVKVQVAASTPQIDVVWGPIVATRQVIVDGAYQVEDGAAVRWIAH
jgi:RND family efflux transporter MFP subunit